MFQTEINHFFQSFASDGLTTFMQLITKLGYMEFFMLFLIVLLLGINFKKAFLMFMVLIWTGAITFFFKDYFDLPRPFHVDNTVQLLDGELPGEATFDFSKRGATSFWAGLPAEVLAEIRQAEGVEHGFPSGHSSIAIAFWGALAFLFRKRWVIGLSIALMLLIPLSRIYLGVHFLADVLGGITLGGIILAAFYWVILKPQKLNAFLAKDHYSIGLNGATAILLLPPFLFMPILSPRIYVLLAFMLGLGLGFLLLAQKGLPTNGGTTGQIAGRLVIGVFIFGGLRALLGMLGEQIDLAENVWFDFFRNMVAGLALIWIGTELSIRLGWFQREKIA
ncbi:MAG: phosphatase PAP2 family protein [Saprospiraceae bacterium]